MVVLQSRGQHFILVEILWSQDLKVEPMKCIFKNFWAWHRRPLKASGTPVSNVPFSCNFFWGFSLVLVSHDQIPASHWSTLLPYHMVGAGGGEAGTHTSLCFFACSKPTWLAVGSPKTNFVFTPYSIFHKFSDLFDYNPLTFIMSKAEERKTQAAPIFP